jgi:hypothetical protein
MSQVEFEEENALDSMRSFESTEQNEGGLIGMVMKTGIAKTTAQANAVLIVIMIICICLMIFFLTR